MKRYRSIRIKKGQFAVSLVVFLVVAVAVCRESLKPVNFRSTLPTGSTQVGTVPFFNAWTIWWNADRAKIGFRDYWQAPIFYPAQGAFAFSEPQPATLILAPLIWLGQSPVIAYKVYLLLSLVLNGLFTARLLRYRLRVASNVSNLGGVMMMLMPMVHQQIDVLQLIPLWGILWTWESFDRLCCTPRPRKALIAGLSFGISFWLCIHHALFMSILLCGPVIVLPRRYRNGRLLVNGLLAFSIAMAMTLPLVLPIRHYLKSYGFTRSSRTVASLSASPVNYLHAAPNSLLSGPVPNGSTRELLVGWTKLTLAALGVCFGLVRRRTRRLTLFLTLTAIMAFTLSLGVNLQFGTWLSWNSLCDWIPGLSFVRSAFRFSYFVQMTIVLMSVCGVALLLRTVRFIPTSFARRKIGTTIVFGLGIFATIESPPAPVTLVGVSDRYANKDWTDYVSQNLSSGHSILCLPFARGLTVRDLDTSARWMYLQTLHHSPMVNGYSGFFPRSWFRIQSALSNEKKIHPSVFAILQRSGLQFIVVKREEYDIQRFTAQLGQTGSLERVFQSSCGIDVYHIHWLTDPPR